jgi:hypothetical protein|tara:strand:+ start:1317 stop:1667 length:351 start_codon:yes stop_codon:yes gene_type:complete
LAKRSISLFPARPGWPAGHQKKEAGQSARPLVCVLFLVKPTKLLHCPDSDNDGFCDNRELAEGTDPNGPENFPAPPFPEDAARYVYFGGFDANFLDAHNTAWIFRAPVETVPTVAP